MKKFAIKLMLFTAILAYGATALAQAAGGPGIVVSVQEEGMATVRIGDQEQTVHLPSAQVGDKVVCAATNDTVKWQCRLHQD
jgi:hypothetical protein